MKNFIKKVKRIIEHMSSCFENGINHEKYRNLEDIRSKWQRKMTQRK